MLTAAPDNRYPMIGTIVGTHQKSATGKWGKVQALGVPRRIAHRNPRAGLGRPLVSLRPLVRSETSRKRQLLWKAQAEEKSCSG